MIADSIVNLCGAIGLGVAMVTLYRRDPRSPLTRRLLVALGIIALLFLMRGTAWWSGSGVLDNLSMIPAALIPLGALLVTEGILRRHAPRPAKIAILAGGIMLGLAGAVGSERFAAPFAVLLVLFQLGGFAVCAWLLAVRDQTTLMASENRSIGRLAVGAVLVIPFIVTDFRVLTPDIPVRLGALGALLVVTAILIAERGAETQRQALMMTVLRLSSSALLGIAAAFVSPDVDAAQVMRFCAIAIAGVLTIGLMVDALRAHFESQVPGVLNSVAASPARTRDALIAELARHPIFESARRYRESELGAYDPPLLRNFLSDCARAAPPRRAVGPFIVRSGRRARDVAAGRQQRDPSHCPVARSDRRHRACGSRDFGRSGHGNGAGAGAAPAGADAGDHLTFHHANFLARLTKCIVTVIRPPP